jgi:streptogramin lyase
VLGAFALPAVAAAIPNPDAAPVTTVISTFAGTGASGFSGDGGPAVAAQLFAPQGASVAADGSVYITDYGNNRIRKVDAQTHTISTVAGNGTSGFSGDGGRATGAQLNNPYAVAVAPDGSVYIGDASNRRVRRVAPDGVISTFAGTGTNSCVSPDGGGQATAVPLSNPRALAVAPDGSRLIDDANCRRIRRVGADGVISTGAGNGTTGFSGDGGAATSAQLASPQGMAVAPDGSVYIADSGNHRIRRVDAQTHIISTVAGIGTGAGTPTGAFSGDGGPATGAELNFPLDVSVSADGSVYFADSNNQRIRKVDAQTQTISTVAGSGISGLPSTVSPRPAPG